MTTKQPAKPDTIASLAKNVLRETQGLAAGLTGSVIKDPGTDNNVWQEYLETIVKRREGWQDLYRACKDLE